MELVTWAASMLQTLFEGKVANAELAAVCDINPDRLKWATEKFGEKVQKFDKAEALIASGAVDGVIIATPHYDHPPLAIEAFNKGLHVLY